MPWWRQQMETFSALLALCAGNSPVSGEFPAHRPVTRSFDVFFDLLLIKRLSKHSRGWWFETLSRSLWRHCYAICEKKMTKIRCWTTFFFNNIYSVASYGTHFDYNLANTWHVKHKIELENYTRAVIATSPRDQLGNSCLHIDSTFICNLLHKQSCFKATASTPAVHRAPFQNNDHLSQVRGFPC